MERLGSGIQTTPFTTTQVPCHCAHAERPSADDPRLLVQAPLDRALSAPGSPLASGLANHAKRRRGTVAGPLVRWWSGAGSSPARHFLLALIAATDRFSSI